MSDTQPVKYQFNRLLKSTDDQPGKIKETIVYSKSPIPPERPDDSVKDLCTVSWEGKIDPTKFPIFTNAAGVEYRELEYTINMKSDGGLLKFSVMLKGKRIGNTRVVFD